MRKMMAQQAELAAACGETVEETETRYGPRKAQRPFFIYSTGKMYCLHFPHWFSSQSDWSEDHDELDGALMSAQGESKDLFSDPRARDSYNLDALSALAATDVEGVMSDDGDDRGHDGDMDDTSVSSRGSPSRLNPDAGEGM